MVRIEVHQVSPWQANCYLIAADGSDECIVVDPGVTASQTVPALLAAAGLRPVLILATHGHIDHVGDAHLLAAAHDVPVHCAAPDHPMLARPALGLGRSAIPLLRQFLGGEELPLPADLRDHSGPVSAAGLTITPHPAPGHTPGSTLLEVTDGPETVVLTGDVLFAGTIGRCDLPGGNMQQMRETLRAIRERFGDDVPLLPGHGEATTLRAEKARNPYLQPDFLR